MEVRGGGFLGIFLPKDKLAYVQMGRLQPQELLLIRPRTAFRLGK